MFLLSKVLPLLLLLLDLLRRRRWPSIAALAVLLLFATALIAEGLWRWLERQGLRVLLNWIPSAKGLDSSSRTLYRAW